MPINVSLQEFRLLIISNFQLIIPYEAYQNLSLREIYRVLNLLIKQKINVEATILGKERV